MTAASAATRSVSDLALASFLLVRGYRLLAVAGTAMRREFRFADVPEADVLAFYNGDDAVSARKLFNAQRDLKGLLHQR